METLTVNSKPGAIRRSLIRETLASWGYTKITFDKTRVEGYVEIDSRPVGVLYCEKQLAAYLVGLSPRAGGCHKKCGECP